MLGPRHAFLLVAVAARAAAAARDALASGCNRVALGFLTALAVLGFAAPAQAGARMYTGSLIIHALGNDTYSSLVGIPLAGNCDQAPYHAKETRTFRTTPTGTQVLTITIPAYGGAVLSGGIDTNGDTLPDVPAGCGRATISAGDPLTGAGPVNTTGATSTSRATNAPRKFTLPIWALRKQKPGASLDNRYGVYLWDVHFADLRNDVGVFSKGGGDGSFAVVRAGRKAIQTAGKNQFGGVMRLLGSYGNNEGYLYNNTTEMVYFNWLFDYLGQGGQATDGGVVTAGYAKTHLNYYYTIWSGFSGLAAKASVEVFKWTTGNVTVTASGGTFPTVLHRQGYDNRTPMGAGAVQMVSPMLTKWVGVYPDDKAAIGIMKVSFAPEPSEWMLLVSGVSMLGLTAWLRRRRG
jgi:hypothetical protein